MCPPLPLPPNGPATVRPAWIAIPPTLPKHEAATTTRTMAGPAGARARTGLRAPKTGRGEMGDRRPAQDQAKRTSVRRDRRRRRRRAWSLSATAIWPRCGLFRKVSRGTSLPVCLVCALAIVPMRLALTERRAPHAARIFHSVCKTRHIGLTVRLFFALALLLSPEVIVRVVAGVVSCVGAMLLFGACSTADTRTLSVYQLQVAASGRSLPPSATPHGRLYVIPRHQELLSRHNGQRGLPDIRL